jgi:hypothetical protein
MTRSTLLFLLFGFLFSCKKAENRTCFKSTGQEIEKEVFLSPFHKVKLNFRIDYILVQDSLDKVVLRGGGNLLNHIQLQVENDCLTLKNDNKCSFLRSYQKKIIAEIHYTDITDLEYRGNESVRNIGVLKTSIFLFKMLEGTGSVNLNIEADHIRTYTSGYGDFIFSGSAKYMNIVANSNSFCDVNEMAVTDSMTVISNTAGLLKIKPDLIKLRAETKRSGNIWYLGQPIIQIYHRYGSGELVNKN